MATPPPPLQGYTGLKDKTDPRALTLGDLLNMNPHRRQSRSVPDAPFVKDTAKWTTLGLKRILRMAADEGYDRIGIVRGEEQAARYDLSKQIDELKWYRDGDKYRVTAMRDGSAVIQKGGLTSSELADTVGKELAEKIVAGAGEEQHGSFSGLDLKVGGEGMKGYYDKIVPEALNKLAKEHGVKVQLEGGRVGKKLRTLAEVDSNMDAIVSELGGRDWSEREDLFRRHQALQKERNQIKAGEGETPIHVLDVPEPMRKQIRKKGFPLYSSMTLGQMAGRQNA